ncbi:MAG TPA: hypothetical protein VG265_05220 [Gaiellaceae bacterium]|jgi:hypothetical protein|nr:hypothetical protein [Gaiellaceae bacterium]
MEDEPRRRRPFGRPKVFELRGPVRSFAIGGLVGAAGTIATVRRLRRSTGRPRAAAGLAAFEDAPCFRETVEREGREYGDRPPHEPVPEEDADPE